MFPAGRGTEIFDFEGEENANRTRLYGTNHLFYFDYQTDSESSSE